MIQKPKGTRDILPQESYKWQCIENKVKDLFQNYGFKEIRVPVFENTELFQRGVGETTDVVQKEMYTFNDKGGRSITLRPEGTAGVVRAYIENGMASMPSPVKLWYNMAMYRYENVQKGRLREFHQIGAEVIGTNSYMSDVETILMANRIFEILNIPNINLEINSIGCPECRKKYQEALKEYIRPNLEEYCETCKTRFEKNPLRILDCKEKRCKELNSGAPIILDYLCEECKTHFENVKNMLDKLNIKYQVEPGIVRGLDYYSHTVFEIISDDPKLGAGATVGGGGRYNGLIEEIGGPATPGVGFAFGMERLLLALDDEEDEDEDGLDCYIMPLGEEAKDLAMQIIAMLRANGFTCEMDHVSRGLKGQFKSADRFNAHFSIILGEEEVKNEVVNIKCNHDKEQVVVPLENILAHIENHLSGGHEHE